MKLIILDRDGVINEDSKEYIKSPEEWIPINKALRAISMLNEMGYTIAIATNQSGINRGLFDEKMLSKIHIKMRNMLSKYGGEIALIKWCPHTDKDYCQCRKPNTKMYLEISNHFNYPLKNTIVVGDSLRDLIAASTVGALPILVLTGKGKETLNNQILPRETKIFSNLFEVACAIKDNLIDSELN